jgi:hypothetical protein
MKKSTKKFAWVKQGWAVEVNVSLIYLHKEWGEWGRLREKGYHEEINKHSTTLFRN